MGVQDSAVPAAYLVREIYNGIAGRGLMELSGSIPPTLFCFILF